jgi:hypothetical protein
MKLVPFSTALVLISMFALTSCLSVKPWEEKGKGPPLLTGEETVVMRRCIQRSAAFNPRGYYTECDQAFRTPDKALIDTIQVSTSIGKKLPLATPIQSQLEQFRTSYPPNSKSPQKSYILYLAALRPAVVIGVPQQRGEYICSITRPENCFTVSEDLPSGSSKHASRSSFRVNFKEPPPIRDGSFVFVPDWDRSSTDLDTSKQSVTLTHQGQTIIVNQENGLWKVQLQK